LKVERFIIEALKTKLLTARIEQAHQRVIVASAVKRAITKQHWTQIRDTLVRWRSSIHQIKENLYDLDAPLV